MHSTEFGELASVLYCRVPGDLYVEFRAVPESRGRTWQQFIPVKRVFNLTVSQHRDEHSFFGVLPRLAKGSGKAANVAMGSAVWVDLDGDGGQLDLRGLPWPSALVCTSPGKFQCYWAMDEPILLYLVEDINQRLVQYLRGDWSCHDCGHLMRVPGSVNLKYHSQPEAYLVEARGGLWTAADLLTVLPPLSTQWRERSRA